MKNILLLIIFLSTLSANQNKLEKVSLQLMWLDQFQFAGYYMAKEKGFYKDVLLDVELKKYKYAMDTIDEVLSGRATFGIGRSSIIKEESDGKNIVLLSAIFQKTPITLISLKSSNINSIEDFKGKRLMLTHDTIETASISAMLMSNKVADDNVVYKEHTFDLEELIDGRVDLYTGYTSNEPYILNQRNIPYKLFSPSDEGFNFYSDYLFTSKNEVRSNSKRVDRFIKASLKGWNYAFDNIDETVNVILRKYNSQNKTAEALIFEANELKKLAYIKGTELGNINENKLQRIFDVYKILGLVNNKLDLHEFVYGRCLHTLNKREKQYLRDKKEIKICVIPDQLPYSAIKNGKFIGIGADILDIVSKEIKTPFKVVKTKSWKESVDRVKRRECDVLPMAEPTPIRKEFLNFTKPYYEEPLVIITDKSKKYIVNIETVLDKEFSVVSGHSFIELLRNKYPNIKLNIVESREEGYLGVQNGKYFGHIDIIMAAAYYMQHSTMIDLKISGQFKDNVKLNFAVRNDDDILFNIFEKVSKSLKKEQLEKISRKWATINYTNGYDYEYIKKIFILVFILTAVFLYRQYILNKKNRELEKLKSELMILNKSLESKVENAVSEIVKKDAYLLHQSRLAQMGEMLSMIAHQWKQPLSSISTMQIAIRMAIELDKYDLDDKLQREDFLEFLHVKLDKIGINIQNLSQIISDFSDFYRPNKESEIMQLDRVVIKSCNLIEDSLDVNNIRLNLDLHSEALANLHENEFMQVILNIISNAQEHSIDKNIEHPYIKIRTYDEGSYSFVEISDNAGGVDNETIEKIFDPYFSTKLEKNGTGLGLYMSKNIIEDYHNGKITVRNNEFGAVFVIKVESEII